MNFPATHEQLISWKNRQPAMRPLVRITSIVPSTTRIIATENRGLANSRAQFRGPRDARAAGAGARVGVLGIVDIRNVGVVVPGMPPGRIDNLKLSQRLLCQGEDTPRYRESARLLRPRSIGSEVF